MIPAHIKLVFFCLLLILGTVLADNQNAQTSEVITSAAAKHRGSNNENQNQNDNENENDHENENDNENENENENGNGNGNGNEDANTSDVEDANTGDVEDANTSEVQDENTSEVQDENTDANTDTGKPADIINQQYDGVLLVANEQTTCAVAFASEAYGYVAATCLIDSNTNQTIDVSQLGIAFYGPETSTSYSVSKVTVHQSFDPATLANNVAVVEVQQSTLTKRQDTSQSMTPISDSITNWDGLYYIRRSLASVPKRVWAPVQVKSGPVDSTDDVCKVGSSIYAANSDAIICSDIAAPALQSADTACNIPLGLVYGSQQATTVAPLAIYSHTAVFGSGICSANSQRHYYTLLGNYLAWGANTVGQTSDAQPQDSGNTASIEDPISTDTGEQVPDAANNGTVVVKAGSADYVMAPPNEGTEQINTYSGNLYSLISAQQPAGTDAIVMSPTTTVTVHVTSTIIVVTGEGAGEEPTDCDEGEGEGEGEGSPSATQGDAGGSTTPPPTDGATTGSTDSGAGTSPTDTSSQDGVDPASTSPIDTSSQDGVDPASTSPTTTLNIVTVNSIDTNVASSNPPSDTDSSSTSTDSSTATSDNNSTEGNSKQSSDSESNSDDAEDGDKDGDGTPDETAQSNGQTKSTSMSSGAKIAIVVVILLSVIAIAVAVWYFKRYRPRKLAQARAHDD
ncbi:hypothetical protein FB645_005683 [Coemansia sp. IMI 203386]|nr:hypothetical protein FB645_005683 [Coemansia sp. IMI 203386]